MDLYYNLLKYPVFSVDTIQQYYNSKESARTALKRLMARGLVTKIRRNLYTCISGETEAPVANRFQIASAVSPTSYVTHHTAMEYYGITDQVYYEVYVASETAFNCFSFDGYNYRCVKTNFLDGVESVQYSGHIRVTDKERTILDSIKDMDKIAGIEEVVAGIQSVKRLNEAKLAHYLELYRNQFLYQKAGFILGHMKNELGLTDEFFSLCKTMAGKSTRYLSSDNQAGSFNAEWNLVVPDYIFNVKNGGQLDADV